VASLRLRDGAPVPGPAGPRPRVVAAMIASVDGRATIDGRSGGLGHPEDRALLRELRTGADAVLVGAGTVATERYATLLDPEQREHRAAAGLPRDPVLATVSRRLTLRAADAPVLTEPDVPVAVYCERGTALPGAGPGVRVHALGDGGVDLARVLSHLHREYGVLTVSCEGGPTLLRRLVAESCLDELMLTVSPRLVAGEGPTSLSGPQLPGPPLMALRDVLRADDHLFLRYVPAGDAS
jgi:riboflavin biosynthesis pyrimidine reductase